MKWMNLYRKQCRLTVIFQQTKHWVIHSLSLLFVDYIQASESLVPSKVLEYSLSRSEEYISSVMSAWRPQYIQYFCSHTNQWVKYIISIYRDSSAPAYHGHHYCCIFRSGVSSIHLAKIQHAIWIQETVSSWNKETLCMQDWKLLGDT